VVFGDFVETQYFVSLQERQKAVARAIPSLGKGRYSFVNHTKIANCQLLTAN